MLVGKVVQTRFGDAFEQTFPQVLVGAYEIFPFGDRQRIGGFPDFHGRSPFGQVGAPRERHGSRTPGPITTASIITQGLVGSGVRRERRLTMVPSVPLSV